MANENAELISVGRDIDTGMKKKTVKFNMKRRRGRDNKINRIIKSLFLILLIFIVAKGIITCTILKVQEKDAKENYSALLAEKNKLEKTVEYVNTPEYIEQAARETLKMVMPGEILFIFNDDESGDDDDKDSE